MCLKIKKMLTKLFGCPDGWFLRVRMSKLCPEALVAMIVLLTLMLLVANLPNTK